LDQIELDSAYDQSEYAPMIGQILKRYGSRSVEIRARLGEPKRFSYGPTPVEALDVFPAV
jgi:arylformamidase